MRILVCGSRTFNNAGVVRAMLNGLYWEFQQDEDGVSVIEGGAEGADALAAEWAEVAPVAHFTYPADWENQGRRAGPLRNQQMLDEGAPNLCLAFIDKPLPESRGTADMVKRCQQAGVYTIVTAAQHIPVEPFTAQGV